jgi:hypothetical protein
MKHCADHDELKDDIKEIKKDVKELLGFKSRILGAISVISFFATLLFNFFFK